MKLRNETADSDVTELRGAMLAQLPAGERFTTEPSVDTPTVWITDQQTGKSVQVPIFAAREVAKALAQLFE